METRQIITIILITLSVIDILITFYYVNKYKHWQPNKPYNLMEKNFLLVFLWNNIGLVLGTIVGAGIIWTLMFLIGKQAWIFLILILIIYLGYTIYNHFININLLNKLIEKYPSGYLPEETFGKVEGNNENKKIREGN